MTLIDGLGIIFSIVISVFGIICIATYIFLKVDEGSDTDER